MRLARGRRMMRRRVSVWSRNGWAWRVMYWTMGASDDAGREGAVQVTRNVRYASAAAMYITISQQFPKKPWGPDSEMNAVGHEVALSGAQQNNGVRPTAGVHL
jgi:hypothetical protein